MIHGTMQESDLTKLSDTDLAAAFNIAYAEYVIPFTMSEAAARQHVATNALALDRSILWRDQVGAVVGLAALGVRGERGWVGGFGLAPTWRGRGLSGPLLARLLDRAREAGLRRVQLEVITSNERAIRTYERAAFRRTRELLFLTGEKGSITDARADTLHDVEPAVLFAAPPHAPVPPCWQRESVSFAARTDLHGLILGSPTAPRAFAVVSLSDTAAAIAVIAGESDGALVELAGSLVARLPAHTLRIANEPEESPVVAALVHAGWREVLRQYEMVCDL